MQTGGAGMEKVRVLLVDDEEEFITALSERLQLRGIDARLAFDGEQGLRLVQDQEPDIMVLDLKMPGIDGMEVLRRVVRGYPGIRVVMLTGHGSEKDREEAMRIGAYGYLQKPVQLEQLMEVIKRAGSERAKQG
jgi:two-component system, OmpR family, response regulator CpxR